MHPMKALQTYWHTLFSSLSNPDYYFLLLKTRLRLSISFFFVTIALTAIAMMFWIRLQSWPLFVASLSETGNTFVDQIPDDARFHYADGALATNLELPFLLESPQRLKDVGLPTHFVGVSAKDEPLDSFVTFGPQMVLVRSSGNVDSLPYKEIFEKESADFTQGDIANVLNSSVQFLDRYAWQINALLATFWFVSKLIEGIIMIALYAFIMQSLGWVMDVRLKYGQVFRWGLHIYPIALGADQISSVIMQSGIPMLSIVYLTFSLVILWRGRTLQRTIQHV
jgi:hypothetical protein